jgi:hypothetical protein
MQAGRRFFLSNISERLLVLTQSKTGLRHLILEVFGVSRAQNREICTLASTSSTRHSTAVFGDLEPENRAALPLSLTQVIGQVKAISIAAIPIRVHRIPP